MFDGSHCPAAGAQSSGGATPYSAAVSNNEKLVQEVRVERTIAAPPDELWALVADVTRMGEWSPEATGARWQGGASGPALGARFKGTNRAGKKSWTTDCTITACEPGKRFAFDVTALGFKVARWTYEFETADGGCRVVERWEDHRGALIAWLGAMVTGEKDRGTHNRETMTVTLDCLADAVERV